MWQSIDPWRDISTPSKHSSISARRVDPEHPFNFFWGRDVRGRPLLALEVSSSVEENGNVPKIRGFEVLCTLDKDAGKLKLIISLRERENIELFHRFCMDLMDAVRSLADEAAAFNIVLRRVWRWQQFLRQGDSKKLTLAAQKGLVGELTFLESILLTNPDSRNAVECWQGPNGEPKDFVLGDTAFEIKTRNAGGRPLIEITSGYQLDNGSLTNLYLYVVELEIASVDINGSFSLDELVKRIRDTLTSTSINEVEIFDFKLTQVGYFPDDDYSDNRWVLTGTEAFIVETSFPRIAHSDAPNGVSDIRYKLDLSACHNYKTDPSQLIGILRGDKS